MNRILVKILSLMFTVVLLACGEKEAGTKEHASEQRQEDRIQISQAQFEQNGMQLGKLQELPFPGTVQVNGMIDVPPENKAVVNATLGGYIKTAPLLIGDRVKKGQALVTLENPEFVNMQQQFMEVSGQLSYLTSEYERQKTLVAEKVSSQKTFLKAESEYRSAFAKYNGLKKQLVMLHLSPTEVEKGNLSSITTIYAPIAGSIPKVNVSRGTYVSPAMSILEIIDNDHIHLELSVFEKDIMNVHKGQKVNFKIPEASTNVYNGEVLLVGTSIDENRTIKVHAHLENEKETNFLTGMFVDAVILTDEKKALGLPEEALVIVDEETYVLVLDEKQNGNYYFKQMPVNIASTYKGNASVEVTDIFNADVQFLTKGAFSLIGN
ncbi:MAG: efflux RND transporter periplasmic adaptor subunit [Maribacter sp.]